MLRVNFGVNGGRGELAHARWSLPPGLRGKASKQSKGFSGDYHYFYI